MVPGSGILLMLSCHLEVALSEIFSVYSWGSSWNNLKRRSLWLLPTPDFWASVCAGGGWEVDSRSLPQPAAQGEPSTLHKLEPVLALQLLFAPALWFRAHGHCHPHPPLPFLQNLKPCTHSSSAKGKGCVIKPERETKMAA